MISKGDAFPEYSLEDEDGGLFGSKDLSGRRYLLFFYAKDGTPGCTRENVDFSNLHDEFADLGVSLVGVSGDSSATHRRFIDKNGLNVKLLSDGDHELAKLVGAYGEKKNYGRIVQGTIRSTFLIGKDGIIEEAWRNVKATGHAERILEAVSSLQN